MNRQASELSKQINAVEQGGSGLKSAHGVLPTALTELCGEIIKALHVRTEAKDWEQFEIKRVTGNPEQPILLRCGDSGYQTVAGCSMRGLSSPWKSWPGDNSSTQTRPRKSFN